MYPWIHKGAKGVLAAEKYMYKKECLIQTQLEYICTYVSMNIKLCHSEHQVRSPLLTNDDDVELTFQYSFFMFMFCRFSKLSSFWK